MTNPQAQVEWDGVCNIEQIASKKVGNFLTVTGFKIATLERLCDTCPMVESCEPSYWKLKNQVRVQRKVEI